MKTALKPSSINEIKTRPPTRPRLFPQVPASWGGMQSWGPARTCLCFSLPHSFSRWDCARPDLLSVLSLATWGQGLARPGPNLSQGHGLGDSLLRLLEPEPRAAWREPLAGAAAAGGAGTSPVSPLIPPAGRPLSCTPPACPSGGGGAECSLGLPPASLLPQAPTGCSPTDWSMAWPKQPGL